MRCTKCNVDLAENYSLCPLCGAEAANEPAKLQDLKIAPYSQEAPLKEDTLPKAKQKFSIEKIKAYFNL